MPAAEYAEEGDDEFDEEKKYAQQKSKAAGSSTKAKRRYWIILAAILPAWQKTDHLDPIVGREEEIERVSQILSRRKKNNPILIGEPGVGKTAIVEGLALRIVQRKVSSVLFDKSVISALTLQHWWPVPNTAASLKKA